LQKLKIQEKGLVKEIRKVLSDDGGSLRKLPRNGIQENKQRERVCLMSIFRYCLMKERKPVKDAAADIIDAALSEFMPDN
jgi:hypothetical protein